MSTIKAANIQNPSAASAAIVLDTSGNFSVPAGTAAAPALYVSGDSNTGIYSPGADSVAISTNGTARATVDSSGRVLIGTTTPRTALGPDIQPLLQVEGTSYALSALSAINNQDNTAPAFVVLGKSRGTSVNSNTIIQNGDAVGEIRFVAADGNDLNGRPGSISCEIDGTPGSNDLPGRLVFSTTADGASSPTERMRITNDGYLRLAGNGLQFNGDTAAANALDDYEEGTFTPVLRFGGNSVGITYSQQVGKYVKIGKVVSWSVDISLSNKGSSTGAATITGLPYSSESNQYPSAPVWAYNMNSLTGSILARVGSSSTTMELYQYTTVDSNTGLTNTTFNNTSQLRMIGMYYA